MSNYLEQIVFEGYAEKSGKFKAGKTEYSYKLRTLSHEQQMEVDSTMQADASQNVIKAGHLYLLEILCRTLVEFDDKKFASVEDCRKFLQTRPTVFVKRLSKIQGDFEKEINSLLSEEEIEKTFSETPSTKSD